MELETPHKVNLPHELMVFFSQHGLTPASAAHLANLAKEYYQRQENEMEHISFTNTSVRLLAATGESATIERAVSDEVFERIPADIEKIARAKALIAWLREALNARDELMRIVSSDKFSRYIEIAGTERIEVPEHPGYRYNPSNRDVLKYADEDFEIRAHLALDLKEAIKKYQQWYEDKLQDAKEAERRASFNSDWRTTVYRKAVVNYKEMKELRQSIREIPLQYQEISSSQMKSLREKALEAHKKALKEYEEMAKRQEIQNLNIDDETRKLKIQVARYIKSLRIVIPESLVGIWKEIESSTR